MLLDPEQIENLIMTIEGQKLAPEQHPLVGKNLKQIFTHANDECGYQADDLSTLLKTLRKQMPLDVHDVNAVESIISRQRAVETKHEDKVLARLKKDKPYNFR